MADWKPSAEYRRIAEANRRYYAQTADQYERSETHLSDQAAQRSVAADLSEIIRLSGRSPGQLQALDACSGSGNIALRLLRQGANVTVADISIDLLGILRAKCDAEGFTPAIVCTEIGSFLAARPASYDLITFSSALHHLENIAEVLSMAYISLRPGGMVYTVLDPIPRAEIGVLTRGLLWADYLAFKALRQTNDLLPSLGRRLRRTFDRPASPHALDDSYLGTLAEYHVARGIDDNALVDQLHAIGYTVVWHKRYAFARFGMTRALLGVLGDKTSFKLLLRKDVVRGSLNRR